MSDHNIIGTFGIGGALARRLAMAAELAPKIRVNCIAPSLTHTPLAEFITRNDATAQDLAALHPLQRVGEAEDIAAMGALLLSAHSSWITRQVIGVDGGRSTLRNKGVRSLSQVSRSVIGK